MKELLTLVALVLSGVLAEVPAPYPASGWRPSGPAFDLPSTQRPIKQSYLPPRYPVDPRIPAVGPTALPGEDVSVQGLPTQEQQPIFQTSPINGQQYVGPDFNADIQNLDQSFRQQQFQAQQERARQLARQRQLESQGFDARRQPTQQTPRQFAQRTTANPESNYETTTEALSLNEGETLEDDNRPAVPAKQKDQVSVEVTKQRLQEYPPEVFLSPLAQLRYQPQVISLDQLSQLKAPVFFQPDASQQQVAQGYDGPAHLSALTSILAQRQSAAQPQEQSQFAQVFFVPQQQAAKVEQPVAQYQPINYQPANYQPAVEAQAYPQYQAQQVVFQQQAVNQQPALNQPQGVDQSQFVYQQYQPQLYQVQGQVNQQPDQVENFNQNQQYQQPQLLQPQFNQQQNQPDQVENFDQSQLGFQPQYYQLQVQPNQNLEPTQNQYALYYQQQVLGQQAQNPQSPLQSGIDVQMQGNGIDEDSQNNGATATAVATAFGTRTQPRVPTRYGAPVPRNQFGAETTTEQNDREETTQTPAIAQATAVANGDRRTSAKLRSRRVRPVFTLDRSGHLVLAQEQ